MFFSSFACNLLLFYWSPVEVVERHWDREAFYNLMIKSQSFSVSDSLGCDPQKLCSLPLFSSFRWDRKAIGSWSWLTTLPPKSTRLLLQRTVWPYIQMVTFPLASAWNMREFLLDPHLENLVGFPERKAHEITPPGVSCSQANPHPASSNSSKLSFKCPYHFVAARAFFFSR